MASFPSTLFPRHVAGLIPSFTTCYPSLSSCLFHGPNFREKLRRFLELKKGHILGLECLERGEGKLILISGSVEVEAQKRNTKERVVQAKN